MTKTNLGSHPVGETIPIQSKTYNPEEVLYDAETTIIDISIIGGSDVVTGEGMTRISQGVYEHNLTPSERGVYTGTITCTTTEGFVKIDEIEFTVYAVV